MIGTLIYRAIVISLLIGAPLLLIYSLARLELWQAAVGACLFACGYALGKY